MNAGLREFRAGQKELREMRTAFQERQQRLNTKVIVIAMVVRTPPRA